MRTISTTRLPGRYLSFEEREEIAILNAQGCTLRDIASKLSGSPSTVSRELRRAAASHDGDLRYRATTAQWHADKPAERPKVAKLAENEALREYV